MKNFLSFMTQLKKENYAETYVTSSDLEKINGSASNKTIANNFKKDTTTSTKGVKMALVTSQADSWKDLLNSKKKAAESVLDVVNSVNLRTAVMEVVGTSSVAVASWNPTKLLDVLGVDSAIGLTSCLVSEQYFNEAQDAHKKFNTLTKKISTDKDATVAFETFVEAISKYNAVIEANIDTVNRYTEKGNYRADMLTAYLSSIAESSIPASEHKAIVKACDAANTTADMIDTVGSKYSGYKAMVETREKWYATWNKLK